MKYSFVRILMLLTLCSCSKTVRDQTSPSETKEIAEMRSRLEQFDKGLLPLSDVSEDADFARNLLLYYSAHSNDMTLKMKLPVSRVLAMSGQFKPAIELASEYIQVYSNDWRGWRILGGANVMLHDFPAALHAYTNATRLGDTASYSQLSGVAMALDRLDILRENLPRLLELKKNSTEDVIPLDIVEFLVFYSIKTEDPKIFVQALDGVKAEDIQSRKDLTEIVKKGCEQFQAKETDNLCRALKEHD